MNDDGVDCTVQPAKTLEKLHQPCSLWPWTPLTINYASILSIAVCGVYWFLSVKETNLIGWGRMGCLWIGCLGLTVNINSRVLLSFFYFQIFNYGWVLVCYYFDLHAHIYRQLAGVISLYFPLLYIYPLIISFCCAKLLLLLY